MSKRASKERTKKSGSELLSMGDGLENLVTGLGTGADKSTYNRWTYDAANHDWPNLINRYRDDWVSQKVVTIIPQDMTRRWRQISTPEGQEADEIFEVSRLFQMAYQWARLYGTAFLLLDLKGTGKLDTPLDMRRLRPGCIKSFQVVDRTRMIPCSDICLEAFNPNYGLPTYYQLANSPARIHHSRFIRFEATELPLWQLQRNQWYSDSVLIPLQKTIDQYHTTAMSAAQLAQEATMDVVTVEGLQGLMTDPEGEAAVMKRFRLMKQAKSVFNTIILDETEEYTTKTIALSGVKDLIWEYLKIVAAAVGIPATRFLSASPDGMNATGESDLVNYIDLITGLQHSVFEPRLKIMDRIIQAHYGLPAYTYSWNSIFPESNTDRSIRAKGMGDTLSALVVNGIITAQDANNILRQEHVFGDAIIGDAPPHAPIPPKAPSDSKE